MNAPRRAFALACALACLASAPPSTADDPLPASNVLRLATAHVVHKSRLRGLALSADGRVLATADEDGEARVWDARSGRHVHTLPEAGYAVALSPDGRMLATAGGLDRRPVRLWDNATGKVIRTFAALPGQPAAFSSDGRLIAGGDGRHAVVCDVATGRVVHRLAGLDGDVTAVAISRDGRWLAAGDTIGKGNTTVIVWRLADGKELCRLVDGDGGGARSVALSSDGTRAAFATPYWAHLWDTATGTRISKLRGDSHGSVAFDFHDRVVAGGAAIRVFDREGKRAILAFRNARDITGLVAVADGDLVASNSTHDGEVRMWARVEPRPFPKGHAGRVYGVAWSPDGKSAATAGEDGTLRLWDAATGMPGKVLECGSARITSGLSDFAFSAEGRSLVGGGHCWDLATGAATASQRAVRALARSRDGKHLAVLNDDGEKSIILLQNEGGHTLHRLHVPHAGVVRGLKDECVFSPDGRRLAVAVRPAPLDPFRPTLYLFDTRTGAVVHRLREDLAGPTRLTYSPDGSLLAVEGRGGELAVHDASSGRTLWTIPGVRGRRSTRAALAFSPDGAMLAAGASSGDITVWEVASGGRAGVLAGDRAVRSEGGLTSLAFSPDGSRLLSGWRSGAAIIWAVLPLSAKVGDPWQALAGTPAEALSAMAALVRSRDEGARLLKRQLKADAPVDAARIARLIAGLTADDFETRQGSEDTLARMGRAAEPFLRRGQAGADLETLKRIGRLLAPLDAFTPAELRDRRAVAVLERICTPAADAILEALARGGEGGLRTLAASAALERMDARRRPAPVRTDLGRPPRHLGGHEGEVRAVAFTPDGKTAISAGRDGKVRLWGEKTLTLDAHSGGAFGVAVSASGKLLATAGADGKVRLWTLPEGKPVRALAGHEGGALCVAFGPGGVIASGGADGKLRLWGADGKAGKAHVVGGRVTSACFTPDGKRVLTGSVETGDGGNLFEGKPIPWTGPGQVRSWTVGRGDTVGLVLTGHDVRMPRDGASALVVHTRTSSVLRNAGEGWWTAYSPWTILLSLPARTSRLSLPGFATADVSADGHVVLAGPGSGAPLGERSYPDPDADISAETCLFDVSSGKRVLSFRIPTAVLAVSPDGKRAILGGKDGAVHLADLAPIIPDASFDALWRDLASEDAAIAYRAAWGLAGMGERVVTLIAARLAPSADDPEMRLLIAGLKAGRHVERKAAAEALAAAGRWAVPALKVALSDPPVKHKAAELLEQPAVGPTSTLRLVRAARILGQIGTPAALEAKKLAEKAVTSP